MFVFAGGRVRCTIAGTDLDVADLVQPAMWSSLVCTTDGSTLALWKDGVMRGQRSTSGGSSAGAAQLVIGGNFETNASPDPEPFDGLIDNVRIWTRTRTADELCRAAAVCRR